MSGRLSGRRFQGGVLIAIAAAGALLLGSALLSVVSPSFALRAGSGADFSAGGSATVVHPGNGSSTGVAATAVGPAGEGHVNLAIPKGLKLQQLTSLSTDYKMVVGSCWAGSPRFTANVTNGTRTDSIFFYIGPPSSACPPGVYTNSGNLATAISLVDTRQLPGGSADQPFSSAQASYGNYTVTAVHLDVDGGEGGDQTVEFDNTEVNGRLVTYEPEHGISFLMERTAGNISIKEPGKRGRKKLKKIEKIEKVKVNSVVDTRGGKVKVTAATGNFGETTADNAMTFYDGRILLRQGRGRNAKATAKLVGKLQCPKRAGGQAKAAKASEGPVATTSRRRRRRVWGSGSGSYGTAGRGGTGSVVGTTWLTQDTCNGTLFKVTEGIGIKVVDKDRNKVVRLGPGQKYFAKDR